MSHAIATRTSHIWYHANRHEQWKSVTKSVFFAKDLGPVKMCPDQSQAFNEVNNSQAFTVGRKNNDPEPLPGAPRHVCTKFRANNRRTDCVGAIYAILSQP